MNSRHWLENLNWRVLGQITHIFWSECWNYEEIGAFWCVGRSGGLLIEEYAGCSSLNRRAASSRELRSSYDRTG
jgi:hypothetical protein